MGCCQNREDAKSAFNRPRHNKSLSIDVQIDSIDQDWVIPSDGLISFGNAQSNDNGRALLMYAQTCNKKKKWEMLSPLITNSTEISESNVALPWTDRPRTIGSVALVYLGFAVKKYTTQVSPYIEVFLPVILAYLKSGSVDQKENSIFLLYNYVDFASEKSISKLLSHKIFQLIARYMISPKSELRRYTANVCYKLYRDNQAAKTDFIASDGNFYLLQLIGWNSNSDFLEELIVYLEEILVEKGDKPISENLNTTKEHLTLEILCKIDLSTRNLELRNSVERLIRFYKSHSTGENSPISVN